MKLQTVRRGGVATFAVLALTGGLAACGSSNTAADTTPNDTTTSTTSDASSPADDSSSSSSDDFSAVFGPGCKNVPTDPTDPGSLQGMVNDPVATAASNNPLLKTLVAAVGAAGLGDTLNSAPALTVFAPDDDAFTALGSSTVNSLVAGAKKDGTSSPLAQILTHHVLGTNIMAADLDGKQTTLDGDKLTIKGTPEKGMTVSDGKVTANIICGNVPTANATVYVIDKVLAGAKVK